MVSSPYSLRPVAAVLFAGGFALALPCVARAQAADSTLDRAETWVKKALITARDQPLGKDAEASQVIGSLASSGDKDLIPIFLKMRQSKALETQIYGMITAALLAKQSGMDPEQKDFNYVDLKLLFSSKDLALVGSGISRLIDGQAISVAQLKEILATAPDTSHRTMAAGELNRIKKLDDRAALMALLKDSKPVVSYYSAVTMLQGDDPQEQKTALTTMMDMTADHDQRQAPVQALMLVRMQKDKIPAGIPWITAIAKDDQLDMGLRLTAISCLLTLGGADGPGILADLIKNEKDYAQQVKLGLIALEHGEMLRREMLAPLANSRSSLVKSIAAMAQKAADRADTTPELLALIKEGHPIILDWSLAYADHAPPDVRLAIRTALVGQSNIVDGVRDRDYERAALAAQKILDGDGPGGRKTIETLLKSNNRAAVEATLAGMYRSTAKDQSQLLLETKVWEGLTQTTSTEIAANYAALILAREGHKEPLAWLPGMVLGASAQGPNFRALAGWYYAKLKDQTEPFLKAVLAD